MRNCLKGGPIAEYRCFKYQITSPDNMAPISSIWRHISTIHYSFISNKLPSGTAASGKTPFFVGKTYATMLKLKISVENRCEYMKSVFIGN